MGEQASWITQFVNHYLGGAALALLSALHIHPGNPNLPIPEHVVMGLLVLLSQGRDLAPVFNAGLLAFLLVAARLAYLGGTGRERCAFALLVTASQRLKQLLRTGDVVARFGSDEFTILLDDIKDAEQAVRALARKDKKP